MTEKAPLVAFGHSHMWGVRRAAPTIALRCGRAISVPLCGTSEMPGQLVYTDVKGRQALTSTLVALLNQLEKSETGGKAWLLSFVQGNYYNQLGMLTHGQPFDFVLPGHPVTELPSQAVLLPCDAVRMSLYEQMAELTQFLPLLKKSRFAGRTLIVSPPPPPRDNSYILSLLGEENEQPTDPNVRLKLWELQDQIYAELCRKNQLIFLSGRLAGFEDDGGFLAPHFVKDAVHANHLWAEHLLEQALGLIDQKEMQDG